LRLLNPIALGFVPLPSRVDYPRHSVTLIAKALLKLEHGKPSRIVTPEDPPFPIGDVNYGDDPEGQAGPRYPSDYAPFKPAGDAMLVGHFHAPGGRPVQLSDVGFSVGNRSLRVAVLGRRIWAPSRRWPTYEAAQPFAKLPLRWENAFGGPGFAANPVGRGFVEGRPTTIDLPQIERPDRPFSGPDQRPDPICFSAIHRNWFLRRALLGTFDRRWQETRWPWFPQDFDWRHFQTAVPELRFREYLVGDETISCKNLHPTLPDYETSLPGVKAIAAVRRQIEGVPGGVRIEPLRMRLDTLWVDMDSETACLVWRGNCPIRDADMSDLTHAWVDLTGLDVPTTDADVVRLAAAGIAAEEAVWEVKPKTPPKDEAPAPAAAAPAPEVDEPLPEVVAAMAQFASLPPEPPLPPPSPEQQAQIQKILAEAEAKVERELGGDEPDDKPPPWTAQRVRQVLADGGTLAGEDLSGLDLENEDLAGRDLTGTVLAKANLRGAKLTGAKLIKASLAGAELGGADLSKAACKEADFSRSKGSNLKAMATDFSGANLAGATWEGAVLTQANLKEVHAAGATLTGAMLRAANLEESDFARARLDRVDFEDVQASGASFVKATVGQGRFVGASLKEADFSEANLQDAVFEKSDLTDVMMEKAVAVRARFNDVKVDGLRAPGADLTGAIVRKAQGETPYFEGAKLFQATLADATLPGADFSRCDLREARLLGCTLKTAKFVLADLRSAQLHASDCFEALFEGALMDNCDGSDTSFFGAEFLDSQVQSFRGRNRNLIKTKLAPSTR
jgi:uncharacterized protein YjbI with pentapeptide repeats